MEDKFAARAKEWDNPAKMAMTGAFVDAIKAKGTIAPDSTIIEVGCGTGLVGLEFADMAKHLTLIDTSPAMLEVLSEKVAHRNISNATIVHGELSQTATCADAIVSFMALHHIANTESFIGELREHLNENGKVVIGDLRSEDGSFHAGESIPHNGFDTVLLAEEFRKQGFREVSTEPLTTVERRGKTYEIFILTALK